MSSILGFSPRAPRCLRYALWTLSLGMIVLAAWPVTAAEREAQAPREVERPALRGQWLLDPSIDSDHVQFGLRVEREGDHSHWGNTVSTARLEGLASDVLKHDVEHVAFRLVQDAGTFHCRGSITDGHGAGTFELVLDPGFARELEGRGVGRPSEAQQVKLAFANAGFGLIDALRDLRYPTPDVSKLVRMAEHGVREDYVRGLADLGFRLGSLDKLIEARDHGVDPRFIRGLQEVGYRGLTYEQLLTARDHGVNPSFVRGMREAGAGIRPIEEMIELRDHGVDPAYVKGMREAGFEHADLKELRVARDHGVDARYVQSLAEAGFGRLSLATAIRARDHGVSGSLARRARERLGPGATIDDAIEWRDRGGR